MKIITVCNQKGGVGKTSVTVNLATCLSLDDPSKKILCVDADAQGNSTLLLYQDPDLLSVEETIAQIFQEKQHKSGNLIKRTRFDRIDIIPSNILLFETETHLNNFAEKKIRLASYLKEFAQYFDYVFIDTPPNLGIFLLNGLYASDYVLIPTVMETLAVRGINYLINTIQYVQNEKAELGESLEIIGILPNKLDLRQRVHSEILEDMRKVLNGLLLDDLAIGINTQMLRAEKMEQTISEYDKSARSYRQFRKVSRWLLGKLSDE